MKKNQKKRWAEKTPDNIFYADFVDKFFPNCQFINVIRDGRDVVSSYKKRWGRLTVLDAMKHWNKSVDLTYKYREKFPQKRYLEVRYEELVSKPETETKRIMKFLDEKWTPKLLEHHKQKHDFWFQIRKKEYIDVMSYEKHPPRHSPSKPIFESSVGKWKTDLNFFEKIIVGD
jgi:hypothetical protein